MALAVIFPSKCPFYYPKVPLELCVPPPPVLACFLCPCFEDCSFFFLTFAILLMTFISADITLHLVDFLMSFDRYDLKGREYMHCMRLFSQQSFFCAVPRHSYHFPYSPNSTSFSRFKFIVGSLQLFCLVMAALLSFPFLSESCV